MFYMFLKVLMLFSRRLMEGWSRWGLTTGGRFRRRRGRVSSGARNATRFHDADAAHVEVQHQDCKSKAIIRPIWWSQSQDSKCQECFMLDHCNFPLHIQVEKAKTCMPDVDSNWKHKNYSRVGRFFQLPPKPFSGFKTTKQR